MNQNITLYAITGNSAVPIEKAVESALRGGADMIQIREKNISREEYIRRTRQLLKVTEKYGVPLIVNDDVYTAKEAGAQGVHLGQEDGSPRKAREILGEKAIIGVTAKTVSQAVEAEKEGADYLGCGAVFGSVTKENAVPLSIEGLKEICSAVTVPVYAIGGINTENAAALTGTGVKGIVVISAIFGKGTEREIEDTARELKKISLEINRQGQEKC
ncbi:MAG: thiamine phosphate synthase [Ruminococcus sp.]|nr:thiamine phosphate synthase [Ruminococcus sp.]